MARKPKNQVILQNGVLQHHHRAAQRLDSIASVRREMSRLYRSVLNGRLPSDEMARLIYGLREIRATLESEPEPLLELTGNYVSDIRIVGIPQNWAVAHLFDHEAHMPSALLERLKEILPADAFTAPPPDIDPRDLPPPSGAAPPALRVYDGGVLELEPDPPPAA